MADPIGRYVKDIEWIQERLLPMDGICKPVMGIGDWDDAACVDFSGRLVASTDGPYAKRLVMKSALVHAATDVVVKGARPLFAMDSMMGPRVDVEDMVDSLKAQAIFMGIPILGGNTLIEEAEPRCSITVVGRLETSQPIRDRTALAGDVIVIVGEPIWGEMEERLNKARVLFDTWFEALDRVKFSSAKDVTKGGLVSVVYEMEKKSGRRFVLDEVPYPRTRNLDNFLATLSEFEYVTLAGICSRNGCRLIRIGTVE